MRPPAYGFVISTAIIGLMVGACRPADFESEAKPQPNVLLVVMDTVRSDALSCYGNPRQTTPNLDRLAASATRFSNAYSTCFWTLPSHASLFTGLYPTQAGATSETNHLPERVTTLAEMMSGAGYRTGAVVRNAWISGERGFAQGFDFFEEDWRGDNQEEVEEEADAVETASAWIGDRVNADEPFFFFLNLNLAHLPYTPPEPHRSRFTAEERTQEQIDRLMAIEGGWGHFAGILKLDESDFRLLRDLYEAEVSIVDDHVGRLLDAVSGFGALDRTLVIITSDHGENLGDHGLIDHVYSLYDTTVRVPMIVRYPGQTQKGGVIDHPVSLIDVMPTILDEAGVSIASGSLAGIALHNSAIRERLSVYAENARPVNGVRLLEKWFPDFDTSTIDHHMRMVRNGPHKLIWVADVSAELFDLENDPGELHDLSRDQPGRRTQLLDELRAWSLGIEPRVPAKAFTSRDEESLELLRALGYIE